MQLDPKYSKIIIQIILITMCCVMVFYTGDLSVLYSMTFQTITILVIFVFGVLIDPSIAFLTACLLTIGLINISKTSIPSHRSTSHNRHECNSHDDDEST